MKIIRKFELILAHYEKVLFFSILILFEYSKVMS